MVYRSGGGYVAGHGKMTMCARCKRTVSKKSTIATNVVLGSVFSQSKKFALNRSSHGEHRIKRGPAIQVVSVTRECRDTKSCRKVAGGQPQETQ